MLVGTGVGKKRKMKILQGATGALKALHSTGYTGTALRAPARKSFIYMPACTCTFCCNSCVTLPVRFTQNPLQLDLYVHNWWLWSLRYLNDIHDVHIA